MAARFIDEMDDTLNMSDDEMKEQLSEMHRYETKQLKKLKNKLFWKVVVLSV